MLLISVLICYICDAQSKAWDILLELTSVAGILCNKCPKQLLEQNCSSSTYFNVISGFYQTAEPRRPCDILVANVGPKIAITAKTAKTANVPKMCKAQNVQKQHFQGLANKVLERSVPECSVCARVLCQPVQACSGPEALSSLPQPSQLIPARSGPRSLAQLPRGPGRVPIIQGASQRSYRAEEP